MQSALVSTESLILRAVVAQYCNPAVGGQGHRDAHGLSAEDPHPSLWISVSTIPNDVETCRAGQMRTCSRLRVPDAKAF